MKFVSSPQQNHRGFSNPPGRSILKRDLTGENPIARSWSTKRVILCLQPTVAFQSRTSWATSQRSCGTRSSVSRKD
jgi:hypothetical protein